jgi:hypothetical protein
LKESLTRLIEFSRVFLCPLMIPNAGNLPLIPLSSGAALSTPKEKKPHIHAVIEAGGVCKLNEESNQRCLSV